MTIGDFLALTIGVLHNDKLDGTTLLVLTVGVLLDGKLDSDRLSLFCLIAEGTVGDLLTGVLLNNKLD